MDDPNVCSGSVVTARGVSFNLLHAQQVVPDRSA